MENVHGKEIRLQYVTVKVPGQKPRGSRSVASQNNNHGGLAKVGKDEKVLLTGYEPIREPSGGEEGEASVNGVHAALDRLTEGTPNVKKRHRRIKSNGLAKIGQGSGGAGTGGDATSGQDDGDVFEFHIVSLDNKQWLFDASSAEERDEWVAAIEQQILSSLQGNEITKARAGGQPLSSTALADQQQAMKSIKGEVPGNTKCVDCDAPGELLRSCSG